MGVIHLCSVYYCTVLDLVLFVQNIWSIIYCTEINVFKNKSTHIMEKWMLKSTTKCSTELMNFFTFLLSALGGISELP